jgi:hypothetical protein
LVFVLLVSVGMSWLAVKLKKARKQREAVEAIERYSGLVFYEHQLDESYTVVRTGNPPGPAFMRKLLGDHFFLTVVQVHTGFRIDCKYVSPLTRLRRLSFGSPQINDADLKWLSGLRQLKQLDLLGTQVTDAGLPHLDTLTNLEYVNLTGTQVTPEGVKKLQEALPDCHIVY